jgi:hypothetical protein
LVADEDYTPLTYYSGCERRYGFFTVATGWVWDLFDPVPGQEELTADLWPDESHGEKWVDPSGTGAEPIKVSIAWGAAPAISFDEAAKTVVQQLTPYTEDRNQ